MGIRSIIDVCVLIDDLGPEATGEVAMVCEDGELRGAVFVEAGRVCWAAARGLARRLTQLLGARALVPREAMESFFASCRKENVPLGEHLVTRGVLDPRDLRDALLQHTAESLSCLCATPLRAEWTPHSGKGYSPRFTFTTAELFARTGALAHVGDAARLARVLAETFGETDWGAAFVRDPELASPRTVAMVGAAPPAATALVRLGRWATSSLDLAGAFSDREALLSTFRSGAAGSRAVVAFRHGDAVVAGETNEHGPARILNRRAQARRMGARDGDV